MLRLVRGLFFLVVLLIVAVLSGYFYLRMSLPKLSGSLTVPGLKDSVEVIRDQHAVPHIYAKNQADAYFALGYVHAQDRLWQMEFQRRVGAGRLAEVVGEAALGTDKFLRTLGVYHYAEATIPNLSVETRGVLESYVAGVNAFLQNKRGPLPPEFLVLRHTPEPWTVADVLVWQKMMAWDLSGNWDDEVLRARMTERLTPEQIAELWPPYPGDAPIALPDFSALYEQLDLDALYATSPKPEPPGAGSNNWVLAGSKSVTGQPLLANDPHLGLGAPSLWYFAHLSAPDLEVMGATLPGTPAVLLGRTDKIAWGFTNTGPDVQDMFLEQVNEPGQYLTPEGYKDFEVRQEVIKVKDKPDVALNVRTSRHGPIISDVSESSRDAADASGNNYVLAFAWPALSDDDLTLQAAINFNHATNWEEFSNALRDFHAPQQNIVYADVEGNIGFYAPAKIPIRKTGSDAKGGGMMPVPGWTGEYDWTGFVPFEALPHAYNPASGEVVTANQKIVPDSYPYFLGNDWAEPYRINRITELLGQVQKHSIETFASIQHDQTSLMAREFLPYLRAVEAETSIEKAAQAELLSWDGTMDKDKAAPLIFAAWYRELARLIYSDELGETFEDYYGFHPLFVSSVLADETKTRWCDDTRTPAQEGCDFVEVRAFKEAIVYLSTTYGDDVSKWQWGNAHYAHSDHAVLTNTPLGRFFDIKIPNGGDAFTVNAARFGIGNEEPFTQTNGPGYRALYDFSDLDASLFIHTTGQSGNPLSGHYKDFAETWRDGRYIPMTMKREDIQKGKLGTLILNP